MYFMPGKFYLICNDACRLCSRNFPATNFLTLAALEKDSHYSRTQQVCHISHLNCQYIIDLEGHSSRSMSELNLLPPEPRLFLIISAIKAARANKQTRCRQAWMVQGELIVH